MYNIRELYNKRGRIMEKGMCTVTVKGEQKSYPKGTTYEQVAKDFQKYYEHDIVLVFVEQYRLQELRKSLDEDCTLDFLTTGDNIGHKTYKRSMSLMMVKAVHDVAGKENIDKVRIHFSLSQGFYCTLEGKIKPNREFLDRVEARMHELVEQKIPIEKESMHTMDAVKLFGALGMHDKERLFEYRRVSKVNVYSMNHFQDYYYGYMVPDAGYLRYFKLYPYDEGFVLQMPVAGEPEVIPPFKPQEKLFQVLKESVAWGDIQDIETVGALNDMITHQDMQEVVLVQEAWQEEKIAEIAREIAARPDVKFVLIAGPSSSGKTTFSRRLSIQLRVNGKAPYPISVDNYFVNREDTPLDEDGKYDFECLEALDLDAFSKDMLDLLEGKEVRIPTFDFEMGRRNYITPPVKLGEQDILVIEGIHCLNPKMTAALNDKNKFKIYISALTQLNIDEHNRIPTTDGRLIRRIVRDARTRGTSAQKTIAMWESVRRGEQNNIFPYQEEADVMFNSALIYELGVLKQYVEPLLFGIPKNCPEYAEAKRLLKFLDYFVGISGQYVPNHSLLREFIGGGCFRL